MYEGVPHRPLDSGLETATLTRAIIPPSVTLSSLAVSRRGSLVPSSRRTYFPTHSSGISSPNTTSSYAVLYLPDTLPHKFLASEEHYRPPTISPQRALYTY